MGVTSEDIKIKARELNIYSMALEAKEGVIGWAVGKFRKLSEEQREIVMSAVRKDDEGFALKTVLLQVAEWAHDEQMKRIPQKLSGEGSDGQIVIRVEGGATSGNNIQTSRFAVPSLQ